MLSRFPVRLVVVVTALAAAACEKVPLGAPTQSTITVSAASTTLALGASTEVTALVVEQSGTPVQNGTLVRFAATLGTMNPVAAETRGGLAVTRFTAANTSGTARIIATSGSATGDDGSHVVEIQIGSAAASSLTLNATPSRVSTSGGTAVVVASVLDGSGNRLSGVPITFTTTAGTLSANSATTDANGAARVQLTTNREATVTASAGGKTATVKVEAGAPASVTLATSPATPNAGQPMTLTITPTAGTAPRVIVNWGDGRLEDIGIVGSARNVTHTYTASGSYVISASATADGETSTTSTTVTVASSAQLTLAVTPTSTTVGSPVSLRVTPVGASTPRVTINWGDGDTQDLGVVSSERTVIHTYDDPDTYVITGTGTSGGDTHRATTTVTINARTPVGVNVTTPDTTPNRCEPVTFTANVTPTTETIRTYEWTIDSNTDSEDATITTTGNTVTRVFSTLGIKTITVEAETPDGRTGTGQIQINVVAGTTTCLQSP